MNTCWIPLSLVLLMSISGGSGLAAQESQAPAPPELAKESGCLECHSVDKPVIGPAWRDVAARYRDDAKERERLIETVKRGGKGNWTRVTRGVPMPPHSRRLTHEEISRLVDWILTLDSRKR